VGALSGAHRAKDGSVTVLLVLKPDKHLRTGYAKTSRRNGGGAARRKLQGVGLNWISDIRRCRPLTGHTVAAQS
jgi:hypothetical protein